MKEPKEEYEARLCAMKADPLYGAEGERAPISVKELARKYGISHSTVATHRIADGILPMKRYEEQKSKRPRLPQAAIKNGKLINAWGRPDGLQDYLDELWIKRGKELKGVLRRSLGV